MANSGDPKPADVSFAQPALIYWRADGGDRQGTLSEVEEYYRSLDHGRLVVRGEPGAGKTVLTIKLVLDRAAAVLAVAESTRPLPVPVRLSLPAFDLGDDSDRATPQMLSARLDSWLIRHLVTTFGLPATVATALVTNGWILLVLDGLDEMDLDDAVPRRAASVIRAVNHPSAGGVRPVVIACRTSRYQQLSGHFESAGKASPPEQQNTLTAVRREVIQDATVVDVQPLTASSMVDYLTYRFPDPAGCDRVEPRWRPVIDRLAADQAGDPLVATLGSPLRLFLVITAYSHPTSTPAELTRLATTAQLDEYLFARLIPLVIFVVVAAWIALRPAVDLRRLDLSGFRTPAGRQRIGQLLAIGLTGGLIVAQVSSAVRLTGELMVTLKFSVIGLVGGLMVALSTGPATRPTVIDRPARLVQQGVVHIIAAMVAFSLVLLLVGEVGTGLSAGVVVSS